MKNMQEANGKSAEGENTDLRNVLGFQEKNPFRTLDRKKLDASLSEMSLIDLQKLAIEAGVSAMGSIPSLRKKIGNAFDTFVAKRSIMDKNKNFGKTNDPFSEEQRKRVRELNV